MLETSPRFRSSLRFFMQAASVSQNAAKIFEIFHISENVLTAVKSWYCPAFWRRAMNLGLFFSPVFTTNMTWLARVFSYTTTLKCTLCKNVHNKKMSFIRCMWLSNYSVDYLTLCIKHQLNKAILPEIMCCWTLYNAS